METGARNAPPLEEQRQLVEEAEFIPLALAVIQHGGDRALLSAMQAARRAPRSDGLPQALVEEVRAQALRILGEREAPVAAAADPALLAALIDLLGDQVDGEAYLPMLSEQAGLVAPAVVPSAPVGADAMEVAIIGAGMSGICAAIALRRAGIAFRIYERSANVGGTWFDNTYPGCGVDTPSLFYSYSFEPGFPWQHNFAKRDQIQAYFEGCVDKYDLRASIELGTEVLAARYDEAAQRWTLRLRCGERERVVQAHALITGVGQLNIPAMPRIEGLDAFEGTVAHTARWPQGLDVSGKRIGMIGTGASGMQVGPAVASQVDKLTIFQRSPHWVLGNAQYHGAISDGQRWLMDKLPHYASWVRAQLIWGYGDSVYPALQVDPEWQSDGGSINSVSERFRQNMLRHLNSELADRPDLIAKTTPDYPPYGKRVLLDNHWYRMLKRGNVELVTDDIRRIEPNGVRTAQGELHEVDVLVLATGFQATRMLSSVDIHGRGGVRLQDVWEGDNPRAYLGITVPRFPNLFILYGPNTNLGYGGSAIFNAECQAHYAVAALTEMRRHGWATMDCRPEVHDAYNETVDRMHERMVWGRQDVNNWYRSQKGRVATNSPWRLVDYWTMTRTPKLADYTLERPRAAVATLASRDADQTVPTK